MRIEPAFLILVLLAGWGPAGCGRARTPHHDPATSGRPVLRAVYRDAKHRLLVVLPDHAHTMPRGDCAAPVLIDETSGAARQISPGEAAEWQRHLQLSGAVEGTCP